MDKGFLHIDEEVNPADLICSTKLYGISSPDLVRFQTTFGDFEGLPLSKFALHWACAAESEEAVKRLLSGTNNETVEDGNGVHPLYYAAQNGCQAICEILLRHNYDPNHLGGHFGSAIQAASSGGHEKVVQMLPDNGADINAQGGEYGNALQAASHRDHEKVVQILLDSGAVRDFH